MTASAAVALSLAEVPHKKISVFTASFALP